MILGDPAQAPAQAPRGQIRVSIDEMFRRLAERRPDALALADPPNRENFTDGAPRRLTYAEADRMVAAIAGRPRRMGLPVDAVIGVQMPNIVENILAMLGVLRAGMVVAPLPLLWRRADAVAALARVGAKALITCGRVGDFKHGPFGMRVAAEVFAIRYVCGFGANLPDGVVPFDDLFTADKLDPIPPLERERQANAAAHLAAITFDVSEGGLVPVARNHSELVAAALVVLLESHLAQNANILSTLAPSSFAGLSLTLLPWLLTGGMLSLHHPFDADVLARQRQDDRCPTLILPGPVASRMAEAGALAGEGQTAVIAAWRGPDGLAMSPTWRSARTALIDVAVFGETGLLAGRRGADGRRSPFNSARSSRRGAVPAESCSPNCCRPPLARCPFAARWCRSIPSRLAPSVPACRTSRSNAAGWWIPIMRSASIPVRTRSWSPARLPGSPASAATGSHSTTSRRSPAVSRAMPRLRRCPICSSNSA